jgi:RNA polymerase-binding protein DksA
MTEQVNGTIAAQELQALLEQIDAHEEDLRTRIAAEKERANAEMTSQLDGVVGDGADYAGARIRAGIENEMVERHLMDLSALEAARQRIKAGTYGVCVDCGEPIGTERLHANPAALRCAECQTARERGALLSQR